MAISMNEARTVHVLCLGGRGVKAAIGARVLERIHMEWGINLYDFDLTVASGTSALYAADMLLHRKHTSDLLRPLHLQTIYDRSVCDVMMKELQFSPAYDGVGKQSLLRNYFGSNTMQDLLPHKLLIPLYNVSQRQPSLLTSYRPEHRQIPLYQVLDASLSVPTYFPPVNIVSLGNHLYYEGQIQPTLTALIHARQEFGLSCTWRILSIGSGLHPGWSTAELESWGSIQWLQHGVWDMLSEAQSESDLQACCHLLKDTSGKRRHRLLSVNEVLPQALNLDDIDHIEELTHVGDQWFQAHRTRLEEFFTPWKKMKQL